MSVLRTFVLGIELGSFARAADRVGRSQSAVSTQLRKLEEQVGHTLVQRAGRGLELTEAGHGMLRYARRILELNDEAVESFRDADLEGWVRLGLPQDFAESWLPDLLGRFARSHPKIKVEVRAEATRGLVEKTIRGDLDICLTWGAANDAPHTERVAEVPIVWIAHEDRPLVDTAGSPIPLVAFEAPCSFREPAVTALDQAGIAWRIAFTSPSLSSLWAASVAGLGVMARTRIGLPANLCTLDPEAANLPPLPSASLTLVSASLDQEEPVTVLTNLLIGVIRDRLSELEH